jgi:hypothetical protein
MKGKIVKEKNRRKGNKKWILSYVFLLASNWSIRLILLVNQSNLVRFVLPGSYAKKKTMLSPTAAYACSPLNTAAMAITPFARFLLDLRLVRWSRGWATQSSTNNLDSQGLVFLSWPRTQKLRNKLC